MLNELGLHTAEKILMTEKVQGRADQHRLMSCEDKHKENKLSQINLEEKKRSDTIGLEKMNVDEQFLATL